MMVYDYLKSLMTDYSGPNFRIVVPEVLDFSYSHSSEPACTILFDREDTLKAALARPDMLTLGQLYVQKKLDLIGDEVAGISVGSYVIQRVQQGGSVLGALGQTIGRIWRSDLLPRQMPQIQHHDSGSQERCRQAISSHYDQPAAFWESWLDPYLQYTCAYFGAAEEGLNAAQVRKMRHIANKLGVRSGHRHLDLGCGWGGFMRFLAENFEIDVTGVTLSAEQRSYCEEKALFGRTGDRCRVLEADFRDAPLIRGYDSISAVGMFEHIGSELGGAFFDRVYGLLKSGGKFLNQAIASSRFKPLIAGESFIDNVIFPDGELLPIDETLGMAERAGFEICDVENLRGHYILTLTHWRERLRQNRDFICRNLGQEVYRAFNLYLTMSEHGFRCGRLQVYQVLLRKPLGEEDRYFATRPV